MVQDTATPLDLVITSLVVMQEDATPLELIITSLVVMQEVQHHWMYNNFLGSCAGYCNTTGVIITSLVIMQDSNNTTGSDNNFFGGYAGYYNTTGSIITSLVVCRILQHHWMYNNFLVLWRN